MTEIRYWVNGERPWEHEIYDVDVLWHQANDAVGGLSNTKGGTYVDEIAVLVPNREMAAGFIMRAVGEGGCTYFNASEDGVHTEPLGSKYEVAYHFLKVPGRAYRLEVMHLLSGHSPLHHRLWIDNLTGPQRLPVVHASFKVPEWEYNDTKDRLWTNGYRPSQECESDYGRFGYWRRPGSPLFFLKPRVNLRDTAVQNHPLPTQTPTTEGFTSVLPRELTGEEFLEDLRTVVEPAKASVPQGNAYGIIPKQVSP